MLDSLTAQANALRKLGREHEAYQIDKRAETTLEISAGISAVLTTHYSEAYQEKFAVAALYVCKCHPSSFAVPA